MEINNDTNNLQLKIVKNTKDSNTTSSKNTSLQQKSDVSNTNTTSKTTTSSQSNISNMLEQNGFEASDLNKEIVKAFTKFGLTPNKQTMANAIKMLSQLKGSQLDINAVTFALTKGISADKLGLIKDYFEGSLKFSNLFKLIGEKQANQLKLAFFKGNFSKKLFDLIANTKTTVDISKQAQKAIANHSADSQTFINLLSSNSNNQIENRLYFQLPFFWDNSNNPDTLEGEVFIPKEKDETGFSLRLMMCPPTLGEMEIRLNRLDNKLWINFAMEEKNSRALISAIIPSLQDKLENLGWKNTKVTVGILKRTDGFFSKPVQQEKAIQSSGVDIRI